MSPTHPPSQSDRVGLLADSTRRRICAILTTADPPRTERDLAVELVARAADIPPREVSREQRRRRQLRLYHHQLPKLADYGLVSYSRSRRTVAITPAGRDALAAAVESRVLPAA